MKSSADTSFDTLPAGRVSKIIQIHPSLQCNLTCRHCYSSSAPAFKGGLDVRTLQQRTEELAAVGYNVVTLSGGEPFLYRPLEELLAHTRSLGFFNSITTNAMLLGSDRAKNVLKQADLIAISIDGKPAQHDQLRNMEGAFKKMEEGLQIVKDHVPNFGFIHTLFPQNWKIIDWLVHFALDHQAKLLHLHPLELSGRAATLLNGVAFDAESLHKIYIIFNVLKEIYEEKLFMQLDLLHKDSLIDNPNFAFHHAGKLDISLSNFSNIFKELIINEEGNIMPIAHGCASHFTLGNIYDKTSCSNMMGRFMEEKMQDIIDLYKITYDHIIQNEEMELVNWSEVVIRFSKELFDAQLVC